MQKSGDGTIRTPPSAETRGLHLPHEAVHATARESRTIRPGVRPRGRFRFGAEPALLRHGEGTARLGARSVPGTVGHGRGEGPRRRLPRRVPGGRGRRDTLARPERGHRSRDIHALHPSRCIAGASRNGPGSQAGRGTSLFRTRPGAGRGCPEVAESPESGLEGFRRWLQSQPAHPLSPGGGRLPIAGDLLDVYPGVEARELRLLGARFNNVTFSSGIFLCGFGAGELQSLPVLPP